MTSNAAARLKAIMEFTELGSGYKLAMRDLEIRGAGNVLGAEQHGHMDKVGYELYSKLLKEELTGETQTVAELDIRVNAYIPEGYIESSAGRLDSYKQIAEIATVADYKRVYTSLQDTYGDIPRAVENLLVIAVLKSYAAKFHVKKIALVNNVGTLEFPSLESLGDQRLLAAMDKYEELQADIFRKDYYFAQALPKAIVAASEVYGSDEYVPVVERYLNLLLENTESNEWSLRYFAAEIYLDLYAKTGDKAYIEKAYDIALNNVNNLVAEQLSMNEVYLADVQEVTIPEDATKEEKNQIKDYNKSLKEQRKVELPPVYEPLVLNCDLLFALADELSIDSTEKNRIEGILRGNGDALFLTETLENRYSFNSTAQSFVAKYDKDTLVLPVVSVNENSVVKVTVMNNGETAVYDDWKIKEVERTSDGVDTYSVTYTSKKAADQAWSADTTVKVEIFVDDTADEADVVINFKVSKYKDLWVVPDTVEFEQVN